MVTTENLADTLIEQLKTREWVRMPASEAEYLAIAEEFPYKLEYHQGELVAMSLTSFWHEVLVNSIGFLLEQYFRDKFFFVTNSNAGLQIPLATGSYYQPDLMVIKGDPVFKIGSTSIITNPYLIVEVTSKSTGKYDKEEKLPLYREIPSLEYALIVSQTRPLVTVEARTKQPNVWLTTDYRTLDSVAQLGDLALPLREICHKITFSE
ncbi:MAG: Uma2 family endonuclease [Bacteroidetes bacterium]|nr:Uma2 family endonuclease [Fibrella sp.]